MEGEGLVRVGVSEASGGRSLLGYGRAWCGSMGSEVSSYWVLCSCLMHALFCATGVDRRKALKMQFHHTAYLPPGCVHLKPAQNHTSESHAKRDPPQQSPALIPDPMAMLPHRELSNLFARLPVLSWAEGRGQWWTKRPSKLLEMRNFIKRTWEMENWESEENKF